MTKEVAERSKRGDRLEEIYIRNAPSALRLAYFLTGDRELAEDLTQEAFVRVAGRFRHLREPDDLPAYLRRTIVNLFTSPLPGAPGSSARGLQRSPTDASRGPPRRGRGPVDVDDAASWGGR
jgi:hypothetical protein